MRAPGKVPERALIGLAKSCSHAGAYRCSQRAGSSDWPGLGHVLVREGKAQANHLEEDGGGVGEASSREMLGWQNQVSPTPCPNSRAYFTSWSHLFIPRTLPSQRLASALCTYSSLYSLSFISQQIFNMHQAQEEPQ